MVKNGNEGFSLVEMIVSVLITAILMLGVVSFISASRIIYTHIGTSSKIQEEAATTSNFLSEIFIEAKNICSSGTINDTANDVDISYWIVKSMNNDEGSSKVVDDGYGNKEVNYDYYFFIFSKAHDSETGDLRYVKYKGNKASLRGIADANNLIINLPDSIKKDYVEDQIKLASNDDDNFNYMYNVVGQCISSMSIEKKFGTMLAVNIEYKFNTMDYASNFNVTSRNKLDGAWE